MSLGDDVPYARFIAVLAQNMNEAGTRGTLGKTRFGQARLQWSNPDGHDLPKVWRSMGAHHWSYDEMCSSAILGYYADYICSVGSNSGVPVDASVFERAPLIDAPSTPATLSTESSTKRAIRLWPPY